jgi:hypothetical protein
VATATCQKGYTSQGDVGQESEGFTAGDATVEDPVS